MTKTVKVETEEDFFARMRKLSGQIDRNEFFGAYENVSFQDAGEMRVFVEQEMKTPAPLTMPKKLNRFELAILAGHSARLWVPLSKAAMKSEFVVSVSDDGELRMITRKKHGPAKRITGPKRA